MADKLNEIYTLRIPDSLKTMIDKLSYNWKVKLNNEIRLVMARVVYESRFDPKLFLNTEDKE